jgi:hypothetical protein
VWRTYLRNTEENRLHAIGQREFENLT